MFEQTFNVRSQVIRDTEVRIHCNVELESYLFTNNVR